MDKSRSTEIRPDSLLTSYQVGSLLQVNPSSINKWVRDGRIQAFRTPGGHRRIRAADLVTFLHSHDMPVPTTLANASRRRLLIVDDDKAQLDSMVRVLKPYQARVDARVVDNGVDALVQVGAFRPHLVVLDVVMPGMDGIEVCRRLKENPETQNIHIVIASAQLTSDVESRALKAGALRCLTKPISVVAILQDLGVAVELTTSL